MRKINQEDLDALVEKMFNYCIEAIAQEDWVLLNRKKIEGVDFEQALMSVIRKTVIDYHKAGSANFFSAIADRFKFGRNEFLAKIKAN